MGQSGHWCRGSGRTAVLLHKVTVFRLEIFGVAQPLKFTYGCSVKLSTDLMIAHIIIFLTNILHFMHS